LCEIYYAHVLFNYCFSSKHACLNFGLIIDLSQPACWKMVQQSEN
jgi:hypothetical protein